MALTDKQKEDRNELLALMQTERIDAAIAARTNAPQYTKNAEGVMVKTEETSTTTSALSGDLAELRKQEIQCIWDCWDILNDDVKVKEYVDKRIIEEDDKETARGQATIDKIIAEKAARSSK